MSFPGNTDENTPQDDSLPEPVLTRSVKLHPTAFNGYVSLRWAVRGCFKGWCNMVIMLTNMQKAHRVFAESWTENLETCIMTFATTAGKSHCDPQHSRKMYEHRRLDQQIHTKIPSYVRAMIRLYVVIAQKM